MHTKSFSIVATLAALFGLVNVAGAQFGPPPGGAYGYAMPPMSPYATPASFGPMGPGPMGPGPMGPGPMGPGPMGPSPMAGKGMGCTDGACGGTGCETPCEGWCHRINVFGEFLYLRPRNAEVAYAVPIDGDVIVDPTSDQVQIGPVELVDPDFSAGFRFGAGFTLSECNAVVVTYSQLDSNTSDSLVVPGGGPVLRSLVSHPSPLNVGADGLDATANLDVQFKLIDVDYKGLFAYCDDYQVAYVVGARYANLEQDFDATFSVNGFETVVSDVEFDGAGLRLGLEGERYGLNTQFFVYGKAAASFVGGEFRTAYQSANQSDPRIVDTEWRAGRLVTILDLEVGVGWKNHCDNLRLSLGYMYSGWHNVVKTNEWINSVQQNNFVDQSDNYNGLMTFDGLTAKVEVLW